METKYVDRDKAFWGAAIGAVGGIVGGLFGRKKRKKQAEAQRQAEIINYQNQQNAIDTQYQNTQNAINAQYEQNVLNVKAQEELNRQQNELAAKKTGIENAAGLTSLYTNESELNKEFRNRFMRCGGGRKVRKCGGSNKKAYGGYTPTSKLLNYKTNTYKIYKPAELEVYDDVADKFNVRKTGENTAKYLNAQNNNVAAMNTLGQNPTAAITAVSQIQSPRYACGGGKKVHKRKC